jgi:hypothetical protein
MSRAAVIALLGNDTYLQTEFDIDVNSIFPTFAMQGTRRPPIDADGFFIILRWEEMLDTVGNVNVLTVWAHRSRSAGVNFDSITKILLRCKDILEDAMHVLGEDGNVLTQAKFKGMGPDVADEGYDTLTRYAVFEVNMKVGS